MTHLQASLDGKTRLILFKWLNAGYFDRVEEVIAIGKVVMHSNNQCCTTRLAGIERFACNRHT